ncbi:sporulation delaying protein family toxin [Virgibacillus kimchii]
MIRLMKKGLVLLLISTLVVFSLGSAVSANQKAAFESKLTGEEIYKGIVFGTGELGEKLELMDSKLMLDAQKDQEALDLIDKIVGEIGNIDPGYFTELQDAAYSQNPMQVDNAIDRGGELLEKALENLGYHISSQEDVDITAAVAGWVAMVGALAYNYAGAVHTALAGVNAGAYLNLYVYQNVEFWGGNSASSKLEREAYIIDVIEALHN